jgi:predicted outer membrane repeat protein
MYKSRLCSIHGKFAARNLSWMLVLFAFCVSAFAATTASENAARRTEPPKLVADSNIPTILYVPSGYPTIQAAVDDAVDGDTVLVADGMYTGPGNTDIGTLGKAITISSENGPANCIIDCNASDAQPHRAFNINLNWQVPPFFPDPNDPNTGPDPVDPNIGPWITDPIIYPNEPAMTIPPLNPFPFPVNNIGPTIDGFTITNGWHASGGAIKNYLQGTIIANCVFIENSSAEYGGAIHSLNANPHINNCLFIRNSTSGAGGAVAAFAPGVCITNCTFVGNLAQGDSNSAGGAIYCRTPVSSQITNCIFSANLADNGPQLAIGQASPDDNWSDDPRVIIIAPAESEITVDFCNIQGALDGIFIDSYQGTLIYGDGNIDADPLFADPCTDDYRLLPESPCIDTGDPDYIPDANNNSDLDGNPRVYNGRLDMGAYEFMPPLDASLQLFPNLLNRNAKGPKRIIALVRLPWEVTQDRFDPDSHLTLYPAGIESGRLYVLPCNRGRYQGTKIFALFNRDQLLDAIPENGSIEIEVCGQLKTGRPFSGSDTLRIKGPRSKPIQTPKPQEKQKHNKKN